MQPDDAIQLTTPGRYQSQNGILVVEEPKTAIKADRGFTALKHLIHVVPTLITFGLFSLSLRSVYAFDLGSPYINSILKAFQFAAKGHEILLTASLSAIVLHRIRYELAAADGVPYGFITSGYQLSSLGYLFSRQYWAAATKRSARIAPTWRLPLAYVILAAIGLTALAGPSSAIAMIPELEWWRVNDPFNGTSGATFVSASYASLWPSDVTIDLLTDGDGFYLECNVTTTMDDACPCAGFGDIDTWSTGFLGKFQSPNITTNDGRITRYLSATTANQSEGWSAASAVSLGTARMLGNLQDYAKLNNLWLAGLARPIYIPSMTTDAPIMKPLVQVQCGNVTNADKVSTIEYPHDQLVTVPAGLYGQDKWNLAPALNFSIGDVVFNWTDLSDQAGRPMLGGIFGFSTVDASQKPSPYNRSLLACTIDARWVAVHPWLDPTIDGTVLQDTPDPMTIVSDTSSNSLLARSRSISIGIEWAEILNSPSGQSLDSAGFFPSDEDTSYPTLSVIEREVAGFGWHDSLGGLDGTFIETMSPWEFATVLSLQITDGLSRVNIDYPTLIYHQNATNESQSYVNNIGDPRQGGISWYPPNEDFDVVARRNTSSYTEVHWEVKRFGYGWGFSGGVTIYLAYTVLLLHAAFALVHIPLAIMRDWTTSSWDEMAGMLALAINSKPSERLTNTSAGIEKSATWREIVQIREAEADDTKLQLVFRDDNGGKKPKMGKKYQ